jgi:acetylornithine/succinyldiaminopimelate/putrescine aminotransferase
MDLMATHNEAMTDPRTREAATMIPVYGQLPFVPERASGCDIFTRDGRQILDLYGGHAVAALGYGHPSLVEAIHTQSSKLLFQSNAVALDIRADAAEKLTRVAPDGIERVFFVNSGAEANENALRMALRATGRSKVLAITMGFHGRTAAAGAVTWNADKWYYGFPSKPFDVDFIPRDDIDSARSMLDDSVACVIFEPVQGVAGAYDLTSEFIETLRTETTKHGDRDDQTRRTPDRRRSSVGHGALRPLFRSASAWRRSGHHHKRKGAGRRHSLRCGSLHSGCRLEVWCR